MLLLIEHGELYDALERSDALMRKAIGLANDASFVDMDIVDQELARWLGFDIDNGGPLDELTISSGADSATPDVFMEQICGAVVKHGYGLDLVLPLVTMNPATVLKLERTGKLEPGKDSDVLVLARDTLDVREVIARGRRLMVDGAPAVREHFLEESRRSIELVGAQREESGA